MASTTIAEPDWAQSIRFDVYQAKLSATTGDFSYFQISRAQWTATRTMAQDIDPDVKKELGHINQVSAETNERAMDDLKKSLEDTSVPDDLPVQLQEDAWVRAIREQNERAKKEVTDRMDAAAEEAIYIIKQLPEETQQTAASAYQVGVDIVLTAFNFLAEKIKDLYNHIVDFLKGIWTALVNAWNAVKHWVGDAVNEIKNFFGFGYLALEQANGIVDVDNLNVSQATKFLLSLAYSFRVPHNQIIASTNRIWNNYLTQYSEATSEQEPQNITVSRKPRPEGDRDTDDKLMFISWQVDSDTGNGRELIEPVIQSEQKALARSYSGGFRYNIVDMDNPSKATQQKRSMGNKQDIELPSRRHKVHH